MPLFPDALVTGLLDAIRACARPGRAALVAIDGPGCSGKSSLTEALRSASDEQVSELGTDAFFAPFDAADARWDANEDLANGITHLRWAELESVVLGALLARRAASYRAYDWAQNALGPELTVEPAPLVVVEGAYALHPRLRPAYDFKIWVDSRAEDRIERVVARDGSELLRLWHELWVPRELAYIARCRPFDAADVFVLGAGLARASTHHTFAWRARATRTE